MDTEYAKALTQDEVKNILSPPPPKEKSVYASFFKVSLIIGLIVCGAIGLIAVLTILCCLLHLPPWLGMGLIIVVPIYLIPTIHAYLNKKKHVWPIFWLNLLLGWTFVLWIYALVLSFDSEKR
jgi:hypothetical protein